MQNVNNYINEVIYVLWKYSKAKVIRGNNYINYDCVVFYIDDGMEITQLTIQVPLEMDMIMPFECVIM